MLYVNRVAHYTDPLDRLTLTAVKSSINLMSRDATPVDTLKIEAINEGVWGDNISVLIENGSRFPDNAFNLIVKHKNNIVEVFKDLSMDETNPDHVELLVNDHSDYITVQDLASASGLPTDRPAVGEYSLLGGDNGLTGITDSDFIGDPSQHTGIFAFDEIDALNILMVPGVTTVPVINAGITYAELRKDLFFIADTPLMLEPLEAVDFRKGQGMYTHAAGEPPEAIWGSHQVCESCDVFFSKLA